MTLMVNAKKRDNDVKRMALGGSGHWQFLCRLNYFLYSPVATTRLRERFLRPDGALLFYTLLLDY